MGLWTKPICDLSFGLVVLFSLLKSGELVLDVQTGQAHTVRRSRYFALLQSCRKFVMLSRLKI